MTWTSFHRRGEVLRTVIATADTHRDGLLPTDVDGVAQTFDDDLDLLGALQLRWHTRLAGRIERELMSQPMDLESGVVDAWLATAHEMPGVRAVLDRHRRQPTDEAMADIMARSDAKEHVLLAVMAGRGTAPAGGRDERTERVGERIAARARAAYVPVAPAEPRENTSLVGRLRAVLAAA